MTKIIKTGIALALLPLVMQASEYVVKNGALSVDATIAKIEKIIDTKKGLGVFTLSSTIKKVQIKLD